MVISPGVRKAAAGFLVTLLLTGPATSTSMAQRGEDIARGLLRALIESQLDKSDRRNNVAPDPFRPPSDRRSPTAQMQQLRPVIATYAQECAELSALLQTDGRRSYQVRGVIPEIIRLQASAAALRQTTDTQSDHRTVLDGYRTLNSDWSTASHQLEHCNGLSDQTRGKIRRLTELDAQYCAILSIQEQYDSLETVRAAYTLNADLRSLEDELRHMNSNPATRLNLESRIRRHRQEADHFGRLAGSRVQFQTIVTEYTDLYQSWSAVRAELTHFTDRHIVRDVQRIQQTHRTMHQLLRLEMRQDKQQVLQLIHGLQSGMTHLFQTITLEQLMTLPDADAVTSAADTSFGTLHNLDDIVHRDGPIQEVAEAWLYADESWSLLAYYLEPIRDLETQRRIREVGSTLDALRHTIGVSVSFDRHALIRIASSMEASAVGLQTAIRRWQTHPGNHDRSLQAQAATLVERCHQLETSLISRRPPDELRRKCDEIIVTWQQIRPELRDCNTDERESINQIVNAMTPEMIRMRTMLNE